MKTIENLLVKLVAIIGLISWPLALYKEITLEITYDEYTSFFDANTSVAADWKRSLWNCKTFKELM